MKDILFTTADFIRSVTIVSDNLQDKYILSSIREAQDIEFQQVIGTRLYNKLKMMVEDESILFDFNVHYRELLDKAQYFIAYQTLANLTVNSTYKINNIGLNTISDENVSTPSLSETFKLAKYYVDKADHYKMMLQNWLLKNKSYFPELLKSDISELSANVHSAASCNVFLGGARGKVSRVPSTLKDESQEANKPFTTGELTVTDNGIYLPKDKDLDAFSKVSVDVQPPLQSKTIELTSNGQSTIVADESFYGLGAVDVNVNISADTFKYVVPNGMKFAYCDVFNNDDFDISNVTDMSNMFNNCSNLASLDIGGWDTSKVTNMANMFEFCHNLASLDIGGWDTSKVTNMASLFHYCGSLASLAIEGWDTSKVTRMDFMFDECRNLSSLDISGWDVSNVTNMSRMFNECQGLAHMNFNAWNVSKVTNMGGMFNSCYGFKSLDLSSWDVGSVTDMNSMFSYCQFMTSLNLSNLDMSNVTNMNYMFEGTFSLSTLNMNGAILPKIDLEIGLHGSNNLTVESLISVLNALPQLSEGESHYIQLGSTNIDKLSDDQKAIAINKGWVLQ